MTQRVIWAENHREPVPEIEILAGFSSYLRQVIYFRLRFSLSESESLRLVPYACPSIAFGNNTYFLTFTSLKTERAVTQDEIISNLSHQLRWWDWILELMRPDANQGLDAFLDLT